MKTIPIGPLDDGQIYNYDPETQSWSDDDGPVDFLPYARSREMGGGKFCFDTENCRWLTSDYMAVPFEESLAIERGFRNKYQLGEDVRMLSPGIGMLDGPPDEILDAYRSLQEDDEEPAGCRAELL